jgi:hypothetical protein
MAEPIAYQDAETEEVVARFHRDGTVTVRVSAEHAAACSALTETCSAVRRRDFTLSQRAALAVRSLYLTFRVTFFYSGLLNLTSLLVLEAPDCFEEPQLDGRCLFTFAGTDRGASSTPMSP